MYINEWLNISLFGWQLWLNKHTFYRLIIKDQFALTLWWARKLYFWFLKYIYICIIFSLWISETDVGLKKTHQFLNGVTWFWAFWLASLQTKTRLHYLIIFLYIPHLGKGNRKWGRLENIRLWLKALIV